MPDSNFGFHATARNDFGFGVDGDPQPHIAHRAQRNVFRREVPLLREPAIARYVEEWGIRSGDSGLIALVDGAPVGAAWLRCFSASEPGYGFVDERTPELSTPGSS